MIRLGLTLLGRGQWTGGDIYLRNMLTVIQTRLSREIEPVLFLTEQENAASGAALAPLLPSPPIVDDRVLDFGRGKGLRSAVLAGNDADAARAFAAQRCNVVFEPALFYGWRFPIPTIAWMPDFQHKYMPEMFPRKNWVRRELGFRAQVASRRLIMLSSETARRDAERFYPGARGNTSVVRFAQSVDIPDLMADRASLIAQYALPDRFVFLPNQFWKHKNHALVADAIIAAARAGIADRLPLIVMSGRQDDNRNPGAYPAFTARLEDASVGGAVRHLGLIPYRDVLRLVGAADALLNPSFFEGWSTTVEEAKALGAPLLVSDIPIHREQAPAARFFQPNDPEGLMRVLLDVQAAPPAARSAVGMLLEAQETRLQSHATALLATCRAALKIRERHA